MKNILVLILSVVKLSGKDGFSLIFDSICMDMDKAKRLFNIENGLNMLGRGGGGWLKFCVCAFGL